MSRQIVDAWFDAFRRKDVSQLKLAEDFVHASPFGEIKGGEVYLDMVRENTDIFFSKEIKIIDVVDGGDKFAVRYLVDNTEACECIYVENGRISKIHAYYHLGEKPVMARLSRWYAG